MLSHSAALLNRKKSSSQNAITKHKNIGAWRFSMFVHAIYTVIFAPLIELF